MTTEGAYLTMKVLRCDRLTLNWPLATQKNLNLPCPILPPPILIYPLIPLSLSRNLLQLLLQRIEELV